MTDAPTTAPPSLGQAVGRVLSLIGKAARRRFAWMIVGIVAAGVLETAAVGGIAFFATTVSNPEAVLTSSYLTKARHLVDFPWLHTVRGLIVGLGVSVLVLLVLKNGLQAAIAYRIGRFSAYVDGAVGEKLLEGMIRMPYPWHLTRNTADLVIAVAWRQYFGSNLIYSTLLLLSDIIMVAVLLVSLLVIAPLVSALVIGTLGAAAFGIYAMVRKPVDTTARTCRNLHESINREATKAIHGIKDVRIFRRESYILDRFGHDVYAFAEAQALQQILTRAPMWIIEVVGFMILTGAIGVMLFLMDATAVTVTGTIALLAVTAWRALPAVNRILGALTQLRNSLPYVARVFEYFDEMVAPPIPTSRPELAEAGLKIFNQDLRLDHVTYSYNNKTEDVLTGVDFSIERGQTIGIVGDSGAGKSTLVDLLIGLFKPTGGTIRIDSRPLEGDLTRRWLDIIGYVPQFPYIVDGTLGENIAFGLNAPDVDRALVERCCRMAAIDFLDQLPDGIDTPIGERGVRLSGGQRQRVAIARALYKQPEVIIFDEATSSLDRASEAAILDTIYSFKGRLTMIIIAHRLASVENCDLLIWLEKGRVRTIDTPDRILPEYQRESQGVANGRLNDKNPQASTENHDGHTPAKYPFS